MSPANYPSFRTGVILLGNPKPSAQYSFHRRDAMHQVKILLFQREKNPIFPFPSSS